MPQPEHDPRRRFHDEIGALVSASGLSLRDLARRSRVGRTTLSDWIQGRALPQDIESLVKIVNVAEAAGATGFPGKDVWRGILRDAKEARDSAPAVEGRPPRRLTLTGGGAIETEIRARTIAATEKALDALDDLAALERAPQDEEHEDYTDWKRRRETILRALHRASLDIADDDLKERMDQAHQVLTWWSGPEHHIRQSERRTRHLAIEDAQMAIRALRTGKVPPEHSAAYKETIEFVDLYIEELELNSRR